MLKQNLLNSWMNWCVPIQVEDPQVHRTGTEAPYTMFEMGNSSIRQGKREDRAREKVNIDWLPRKSVKSLLLEKLNYD